jgi:hypothetical protein
LCKPSKFEEAVEWLVIFGFGPFDEPVMNDLMGGFGLTIQQAFDAILRANLIRARSS